MTMSIECSENENSTFHVPQVTRIIFQSFSLKAPESFPGSFGHTEYLSAQFGGIPNVEWTRRSRFPNFGNHCTVTNNFPLQNVEVERSPILTLPVSAPILWRHFETPRIQYWLANRRSVRKLKMCLVSVKMVCSALSVSCVILIILALVKLYLKLSTGIYKGRERLDGKTVIITGSNAGIGFETAKDLAGRGAKIIMVCRNMQKARKCKDEITMASGNKNITIKHVDFASLESVRKCAKEIYNEVNKIDILINNAGEVGFGVCVTDDGLEKVMQTNHYGPFLFTHILIDKLVKSAPSQIINVSSDAYKMKKFDFELYKNLKVESYKPTIYNQFYLYAQSKLANVYFTRILAEKLKGKGVRVNCLHPGAVNTEIIRYAGNWYQLVYSCLFYPFFKTTKEGAQTTIYVCCSPEIAHVTGEYFMDCKRVELAPIGKDMGAAKKLWEISEQAVKLEPNEKCKF